jgi:murein DD-endopeptidase MepM/ murein hydrolase activator NlpD
VDHRPPRGRYRGRRRVPTPPRSRYAAVLTTAVVGAGVVAFGTGAAFPDGGTSLAAIDASLDGGLGAGDLANRIAGGERSSRSHSRTPVTTSDQAAPNIWLLPLRDYHVTSLFGQRWGKLHPGVDLGAPEGTPYYAAAAGTVILCRWNSGYGYNVMIDHGNGVVSVYGHSSKLLCREGQKVRAGDLIALVGNTGYSFGAHLHFEIRINDKPINPIPFMRARGVDIPAQVDAAYSGGTDSP